MIADETGKLKNKTLVFMFELYKDLVCVCESSILSAESINIIFDLEQYLELLIVSDAK
jgi:hypothetical protein